MSILTQLICAHLVGDFLLQNDWMQAKAKSSYVCLIHVAVYSLPFLLGVHFYDRNTGLFPGWMFTAIMIEHFLQDRFRLHCWWMLLYRQTPVDRWPVGPLCVDQAMHIGFIWLFASIAGIA